MNNLKLEVVRFGSEDVIATSIFKGLFFATKSEYNQFDPSQSIDDNYAAIRVYADDFAIYEGSLYEPGGTGRKYAWYDASTSQWHNNNKIADYYYNPNTDTYKFPTGKD